MKKLIALLVFLAGIIFTFQSCEYSPPEIPLTVINKPSDIAPEIWIDLSPKIDTLKLVTSANVTYTVDAGDRKLYKVEFYIDENKIEYNYNTSPKSFYATIPVDNYEDGLHTLKVVTITSTNTGSIADKIDAEQYSYDLSWPLFINKKARNNSKIATFESTAEGIKIGWGKYDFQGFKSYNLTRHSRISGGSAVLINTTDPNQNFVVDKGYLEGDYFYYAFSMNTDNGSSSDSKTYVEEIQKPKVTINSDRIPVASWKPSKYPQNQKSYYLKISVPQYGYPQEQEIMDLNQTSTTFNDQIGFGGNYTLQLRYIPKNFESYYSFDVAGGLTSFALGDSIPAFERGFMNRSTNSILGYSNGKFFKYYISTGQSSESISIKPIESFYQSLIVSSSDGNLFGYFEDQQFVVRHTSDWSLVRKMNIEAYNGYNSQAKKISLSNNAILAFVDIWDVLRIFDFQQGTKVLEKKNDTLYGIWDVVISPDGKQICIRKSNPERSNSLIAFTIESGQLKQTGIYTTTEDEYDSKYFYSPVTGKLIYFNYYYIHTYKVEILDPQSLTVEHTVVVPRLFVPVTYDYENDRVIAQYQSFPTEKFSYLIDVKTGNRSQIVPFSGRQEFLFSNGRVYSGNGRSIKIDDYFIE